MKERRETRSREKQRDVSKDIQECSEAIKSYFLIL
jgi:hypothetical protein